MYWMWRKAVARIRKGKLFLMREHGRRAYFALTQVRLKSLKPAMMEKNKF